MTVVLQELRTKVSGLAGASGINTSNAGLNEAVTRVHKISVSIFLDLNNDMI